MRVNGGAHAIVPVDGGGLRDDGCVLRGLNCAAAQVVRTFANDAPIEINDNAPATLSPSKIRARADRRGGEGPRDTSQLLACSGRRPGGTNRF